jgi:hypothetical protein
MCQVGQQCRLLPAQMGGQKQSNWEGWALDRDASGIGNVVVAGIVPWTSNQERRIPPAITASRRQNVEWETICPRPPDRNPGHLSG